LLGVDVRRGDTPEFAFGVVYVTEDAMLCGAPSVSVCQSNKFRDNATPETFARLGKSEMNHASTL
jgi:hypothetical protein